MAKPLPRRTLKDHVRAIMDSMPDGTKVSFELRTSFDKVTDDYIVGHRGYYDEDMLLRFSVTKPKDTARGKE